MTHGITLIASGSVNCYISLLDNGYSVLLPINSQNNAN